MRDVVLDGTAVTILEPKPCEVEGCTEMTPTLIASDPTLSVTIKRNGTWHLWCMRHIKEEFPDA